MKNASKNNNETPKVVITSLAFLVALVVFTDNDYVVDYCKKNGIKVWLQKRSKKGEGNEKRNS